MASLPSLISGWNNFLIGSVNTLVPRKHFEKVRTAIANSDAGALYSLDSEYVPFFCPQCRAIYCGDHWERWDVFADDHPFCTTRFGDGAPRATNASCKSETCCNSDPRRLHGRCRLTIQLYCHNMLYETPDTPARTYTLDELCTLAELPKRTVRYYIQLGLVDRPIGETRAAHYTSRQLEQLLTDPQMVAGGRLAGADPRTARWRAAAGSAAAPRAPARSRSGAI